MADPISIFDVIQRGGYEASLITTFNATLPFYEEVVLRKLVGSGCRHNVVLMDQGQCAQAWDAEASRPRLAGYAYTLLPVGVSGAFHPKVCLLLGPKKASILIGSHNLTLSGFGYNREVTNWIEVAGPKDTEGASLLYAVWQMVRRWIELERDTAPEPLLESALALSNFVAPLTVNSGVAPSVFALDQIPGGPRLVEQMAQRAPSHVERIGVIGAFFDHDLAFISELRRLWPAAELVVGIDPESVQLPAIPKTGDVRYVDVRQLWPDDRGYLHAKVIFLDSGVADTRMFVSGSANPSRPAWLGTATSSNIEAVLLRIGDDARHAAERTGLQGIFALPALGADILEAIARRSVSALNSEGLQSVPVWIGTTDLETDEVRISCRGKQLGIERVTLLGPNMEVLEETDALVIDGNNIVLRPTIELTRIRSCTLWREGIAAVRVMIQHPSALSQSSQSSRQYQIRTALSSLGSSEGDISKVIATVERVIFSDETTKELDVAIREHKEKRDKSVAPAGPSSLAVSVVDLPKSKKKIRLLKSGDLAYLIDVLLRRLSEGLETQTVETDPAGRTEEEQVGKDDADVPEPTTPGQPATTLNDVDVAAAVARRARSLTRRMVDQLKLAARDESRRTGAVLQLIAVLALLRELRHLDKMSRWRSTGQPLAAEKDRRYLLDESLKYLLGSTNHLIDITDKQAGESTEEALQLRVLLLWLAWDLGEELTEQIGRMWDAKELQARLHANAVFLKLIPAVSVDDAARVELEESILRTVRATPEAAVRATKWLEKHLDFGVAWSSGIQEGKDLRVGGYCRVPGKVDEPQVVVEVSDNVVGFWDYDRIRRFARSRVVGVTPSSAMQK